MKRPPEDFREEIEAHIAHETDRLTADGMAPADARDRAIKRFGGVLRAQERFYESSPFAWLDHAARDVRHALRSLTKSPLFATTVMHLTELRRARPSSPTPLVVVGVVGNVRSRAEAARPMIYLPYAQRHVSRFAIVAQTENAARFVRGVRDAVTAIDPDLPILGAQTLDEALAVERIPQRVAALASGGLGAIGLLLAVIGVYGVTAYAVSARTREIGIRVALGARRAAIVRMVLGHGGALVGLGVAVGVSAAAAAASVLRAVFQGFPAGDVWSLGAAAAIFAIAGVVACFVPARRALAVDPIATLRCE